MNGNGFDLHFRTLRQGAHLNGGTRRGRSCEEAGVGGVHLGKAAEIRHENRGLDNVAKLQTLGPEDSLEVTKHLPRLRADIAPDQLVGLWIHGRSTHTQRAYLADVDGFRSRAGKTFSSVTLSDLQDFAASLEDLAPATRYRALSAIKSLLAFGHRIGYLPFDVGRVLRLPSFRNRLSERILPEADVHWMLSLEPDNRNRALLTLLYASGIRVSGRLMAFLRHADMRGTRKADSVGEPSIPAVYCAYRDAGMHR